MPNRSPFIFIAPLLLLPWAASPGTTSLAAEPYPSAPIKLVLPLASGGATDNLARIAGNAASARLGQPIVIENRPGGGGSIASNVVAKSSADGYTLLLANFATHAVAPSMFASLPYDPIQDFAPISLLASSPHVLLVNPDLDVHSVADLIALAKAKPGKLNYASSGIGSPLHLAGEYFNAKAGTEIVHVPYKSSVPALVDVMSGRVDMMFDNLSTGLPYVIGNKLRGLAVTSGQRSALAPDIPTVSESGLRDFETYGWWGILAPAKTPPEVVARLSAAFMAAMQTPEVKSMLIEQGYDPVGSDPAAFAVHIQREIAKWRPVIKATNITAGN
jgi:tripartite-type tricarboxylate transporter receptor subunit TctC